MPNEITITLPDITEKTTQDDVGIMPEEWLQQVINCAAGEDFRGTENELFFVRGFITCATMLTSFSTSCPKTLKECYQTALDNTKNESLRQTLEHTFLGGGAR